MRPAVTQVATTHPPPADRPVPTRRAPSPRPERIEQVPDRHRVAYREGKAGAPPGEKRPLGSAGPVEGSFVRTGVTDGQRFRHTNSPTISRAIATTIPPAIAAPVDGPGSARRSRMARSLRCHEIHEWTAATTARRMNTALATNLRTGWMCRASASIATPTARRASDVRIQARNVRSFARLNRGPAPHPTP